MHESTNRRSSVVDAIGVVCRTAVVQPISDVAIVCAVKATNFDLAIDFHGAEAVRDCDVAVLAVSLCPSMCRGEGRGGNLGEGLVVGAMSLFFSTKGLPVLSYSNYISRA